MQGLDFEIIYKKCKENVVEDVLSRIEPSFNLYSITSSIHMWLEEDSHEGKEDNTSRQEMQCLKEGNISMEHWEWKRGILWYKGRIFYALNHSWNNNINEVS